MVNGRKWHKAEIHHFQAKTQEFKCAEITTVVVSHPSLQANPTAVDEVI